MPINGHYAGLDWPADPDERRAPRAPFGMQEWDSHVFYSSTTQRRSKPLIHQLLPITLRVQRRRVHPGYGSAAGQGRWRNQLEAGYARGREWRVRLTLMGIRFWCWQGLKTDLIQFGWWVLEYSWFDVSHLLLPSLWALKFFVLFA